MQNKGKPIGTRNGLKIYTKIKTTSKERYIQNKAERKLKERLMERCQGLCEKCHQKPDFRGLSKHEIIFRSHGGDPLDETNTIMLCGKCHNLAHHIVEK
jgi:5-methylcytosine-specific restriction endonuclease McrA